jgi:hypothetical protein
VPHGATSTTRVIATVVGLALFATIGAGCARSVHTSGGRSATTSGLVTAPARTSAAAEVVLRRQSGSDRDSIAVSTAAGVRIDIARNPEAGLSVQARPGGRLAIGIPNAATSGPGALASDGTVVFPSAPSHTVEEVQALPNGGFRVMVTLESAAAPREYRFDLGLPTGTSARLTSDQSVLITDRSGGIVGAFDPPWARDASGQPVRTRYHLDGSVLIQSVLPTSRSTYPIVADPSGWWGWLKCTASIAALIATNTLAALKIARIGGVLRAIRALRAAANRSARIKAIKTLLAEVTGVGSVLSNCS